MQLLCCSKKKRNKKELSKIIFVPNNFLNNCKSKEKQKFIGHKFKNQKYLIGINIIPSEISTNFLQNLILFFGYLQIQIKISL